MPVSSTSFKPGNPGGGRPPDSPEVKAAKELARTHAKKAIEVLIELMGKQYSEKTRLLAANSVLDRGLGKPVQDQSDTDIGGKNIIIEIYENGYANSDTE